MVELSLFLSILAVTLPICVTGVFVAKLWRKNADLDPKITHKLRKQQEEYIAELEHKVRQKQNKLNAMEKGPVLTAESGDLKSALPELVSQVSQYAPKWIQNLIKSEPQLINYALDYAAKNPDKAKQLTDFIKTKFTKVKPETAATNAAGL